MKHLVGKVITEKVDFMGEQVDVKKLSVSQVLAIQKLIQKAQNKKDEYNDVSLIQDVIRMSVIGAEEITDKEFEDFPVGELTQLSESIMSLAGLGATDSGN